MNLVDLTGKRYGKLTVLSRSDDYISPGGHALVQWNCKCDCGSVVIVSGSNLKSGRQISCGCQNRLLGKKRIDLTGQKFGRLTVIQFSRNSNDRQAVWKCKCECGNYVEVAAIRLKNGTTKSCGCYWKEKMHERKTIFSGRMYYIWESMKQRCENPNNSSYLRYGGRGICVCEEWHDFKNFYTWSINNGYSDDLSIDRVDNNGNYCPENCRWADKYIQANNKRSNVLIEINGEVKTAAEWSRITGIPSKNIRERLDIGWSGNDAVNIPILPVGKNKSQFIGG